MLEERHDEIESGKLAILIADECHLLWGDTTGYVLQKTQRKGFRYRLKGTSNSYLQNENTFFQRIRFILMLVPQITR